MHAKRCSDTSMDLGNIRTAKLCFNTARNCSEGHSTDCWESHWIMDDIAEIQQAILGLLWKSNFSGVQLDEIHTFNIVQEDVTYLSGDEGMEASTILHSTQSRKIRQDGSLTFYRPPPLLSFHVANASKCQKNLASLFKRPMYGRAMSFSQSTQRAKRRISRPTDVLRIQNAAIAQRRNGCHCGKHLEHGPVTAEAKLFPTCCLY